MAGTRFADWLYCNVWSDEDEIRNGGDCHIAPVPLRYGRRVMYCFADHNELVRFPHVDLAKLAYREALVHLARMERLAAEVDDFERVS